jgi:hypothetical protein
MVAWHRAIRTDVLRRCERMTRTTLAGFPCIHSLTITRSTLQCSPQVMRP